MAFVAGIFERAAHAAGHKLLGIHGRGRKRVCCADFESIHSELDNKYYGLRSTIPSFLDGAIAFAKSSSEADILHKNAMPAHRLLQMHSDTAKMNEEFQKGMPEHVLKVQRERNFAFLLRCAELAGHPDKNLKEDFQIGFPTVGPIEKSFVWDALDGEDVADKSDVFRRQTPVIRKKPPGFMHAKDLQRLWDESAWLRDGGLVVELDESELKSNPVYGFGVHQGGTVRTDDDGYEVPAKLRNCFDFRPQNSFCPQVEKMRLCSNRVLIDVIARCMCKSNDVRAPVLRGRRDILADITAEKEAFVRNIAWDAEMTSTVDNAGKWDCFVPALCKRDFSKWYYQSACRQPLENIIAIWCTSENRYKFYASLVMMFGSVHSAFGCVRISECLMRVQAVLLLLVCFIYIDDTILLCRRETLASSAALLDLFYSLTGFVMSRGKEDSHLLSESLCVLGLMYRRSPDLIEVSIPLDKIAKCKSMIDSCAAAVLERRAEPRAFEQLRGMLVHVCQCREFKTGAGFIMGLNSWTYICLV